MLYRLMYVSVVGFWFFLTWYVWTALSSLTIAMPI